MEKKPYENLEIEVARFDAADVITTSPDTVVNCPNDGPK